MSTSPTFPLTASLPLHLPTAKSAARWETSPLSQSTTGSESAPIPIICISHLSWDWVWQRPQQFLSRLARTHPVLFVETYRSEETATWTRLRPAPQPNVTIFETHVPASRWEDGEFVDTERRKALQQVLREELADRFARPILWFYDPMPVHAFAGQLDEQLIVYDCMDELSQFKGAPPELRERDRKLIMLADVVFCGGRKMRDKRRPLNANCHFYGTGVDIDHFGAALSDALEIDPDIAALKPPVLGYFGVVDERIDYDLLAKLADARPGWSIAMIGPVAKVDPADFPRRPNLHWLGGRPYERLPAITKGFSVCLMPFALNEATEYINPTKALEYMAAGRPIVSTALDEVKTNFGRVCRVAESHEAFVAQCEAEVDTPSHLRIERGLRLARRNTWEAITAALERHLEEAIQARSRSTSAISDATSLLTFGSKRTAYV